MLFFSKLVWVQAGGRNSFFPNTNNNMDSKDNEYNPDKNTNMVLKKGWGGRVWTGQEQFSSK